MLISLRQLCSLVSCCCGTTTIYYYTIDTFGSWTAVRATAVAVLTYVRECFALFGGKHELLHGLAGLRPLVLLWVDFDFQFSTTCCKIWRFYCCVLTAACMLQEIQAYINVGGGGSRYVLYLCIYEVYSSWTWRDDDEEEAVANPRLCPLELVILIKLQYTTVQRIY